MPLLALMQSQKQSTWVFRSTEADFGKELVVEMPAKQLAHCPLAPLAAQV
jgi:hypothetical protein